MARLEGVSEDDENLERNASMKTWLVLGFWFGVFCCCCRLVGGFLFFVLFYLSNLSFIRKYHMDKLSRLSQRRPGQLALNGFNTKLIKTKTFKHNNSKHGLQLHTCQATAIAMQ